MSPLPEVPRQTARAARRVLGRAALERVLAVVLVALLVAALVPWSRSLPLTTAMPTTGITRR